MTRNPRLIAALLFLLGFAGYWFFGPESGKPSVPPQVTADGGYTFAGRGMETTGLFHTQSGTYELTVTGAHPWQATILGLTGTGVAGTAGSDAAVHPLTLPKGPHRLQMITEGDWRATLRRHAGKAPPPPAATWRNAVPSPR